MALLKFYRGAVAPTSPVQGMIWFNNVTETVEGVEQVKNLIKVYTGTEWEVYGTTDADLKALVARVATLEGDVKDITETTLPALEAALKKYADDAVTVEAGRAAEAEGELADRLDVIEGEGDGSIKKAVADAKAELIGGATTEGDTLGKLETLIKGVSADAKTYSIAKVTEGLGTNIKEAYKLVDEDGTQCGTLIEIEKDDSLVDVVTTTDEAGNQVVKFTYNLADGTSKEVTIDLSAYVTESEYGDGLQVVDHVVSVKKDATSESFLTVGADGVKLSGVQDAIDAAEAAANKYTDDAIAALDTTVDSTSTLAEYAGEKDAEDTTSKIAIKLVETDGKVTSIAVTETDIASAKMVHDHEQVVSGALNELNARMTTAEGSVADHETRLTQAEADIVALEAWKDGLNTGVMSVTGDESDAYVKVAANPTTGDVTLDVTVASVDAANGGAQGLATDAYVREQIAAAAMVWEQGSF